MVFHSIFLMGAFCAAMNLQPELEPADEDLVSYPGPSNGMKIGARCLSSPSLPFLHVSEFARETCRTLTQVVKTLP